MPGGIWHVPRARGFARVRTGKAPSKFSLADLDSTLIGAFLQHLEEQRGNGVATLRLPKMSSGQVGAVKPGTRTSGVVALADHVGVVAWEAVTTA
jgi:hypothetical protein